MLNGLTVAEVSKAIDRNQIWVAKACRMKLIKGQKSGKGWLIPESEVVRLEKEGLPTISKKDWGYEK